MGVHARAFNHRRERKREKASPLKDPIDRLQLSNVMHIEIPSCPSSILPSFLSHLPFFIDLYKKQNTNVMVNYLFIDKIKGDRRKVVLIQT